MRKLSIPFPGIDRQATRKRVEEQLETARIYNQMGFVRRETRVTMNYAPRMSGGDTNTVSKPVEETAAWNVDNEARMRAVAESVEQAVAALGRIEREIVTQRYLQDELMFDFQVFANLHISERQYYRLKSSALLKLAFMLSLEVPAANKHSAALL